METLAKKISKVCHKYHLSANQIQNIQLMIIVLTKNKKVTINSEFSEKTSPVYKALIEIVNLINKDKEIKISIDPQNIVYSKMTE